MKNKGLEPGDDGIWMMKWGLMFTECSLVSLRVGFLNLSMADTARN